jgi:Domain of unknown function (DUF4149)
MRYLAIGERIIVSLWVGGLWAIGFLAAPVLFHSLDNRALAGALAAPMFTIINGFGLVCGGLLLLFSALSRERGGFRSWRTVVIAAMMAVAAIILFVIQPQMAALKAQVAAAGGELGARFGRLHGISFALYLIASVLGLLLAAGGDRRGEREWIED